MSDSQLVRDQDRLKVLQENVIPKMDEISKCLLMHGFIFVLIVHTFFETVEVLSRSDDGSSVDISLVPIRGLRWLKARIKFSDDSQLVFFPIGGLKWMKVRIQTDSEGVWVTFLFWHLPGRKAGRIRLGPSSSDGPKLPAAGLILTVLCFILATIIEATIYTGVAVFRASFTTFAMAMRAIPFLMAILLVVFSSSDAWRVYGSEAYVRFIVIVAILAALAIAAVYRIVADEAEKIVAKRQSTGDWTGNSRRPRCAPIVLDLIKDDYSAKAALVNRKAEVLTRYRITPLGMTDQRWTRILTKNVQILLRFTTVMQVVAVTLWVSGSFIALGIIVIGSGAYGDLLPVKIQPSIIYNFHIFGQTFIFSQQLVLLSVTLGTIAGLTFATVSLQDEGSRDRFFSHSLSDLRSSLATLSYYLGAVDELCLLLRDRSRIGIQLGFNAARFRRFDDAMLQQASRVIHTPSEKVKETLLELLSKVAKDVAEKRHLPESRVRAAIFYKAGEFLRIMPGVAWNMNDPAELQIEIGIGQGSAGRAFQTGQSSLAIYHRARSDSSIQDPEQRSRVDPDLKWIISIPILGSAKEVIGVLNVDGLKTELTREQLEASVGALIRWGQLAGYVLGLDAEDNGEVDENGR